MKEETQRKLEEITRHKTVREAVCLTIEESSELIKQLCKLDRNIIDDTALRQEYAITRYKLLEEIADLEIMLEQLKTVLAIKQEDIEAIKEQKTFRTYQIMLSSGALDEERKPK